MANAGSTHANQHVPRADWRDGDFAQLDGGARRDELNGLQGVDPGRIDAFMSIMYRSRDGLAVLLQY